MDGSSIKRYESCGVTLLGDVSCPYGVTFAFTERTGGVSQGPYASLNLGSRCGDNPRAVEQNRARALQALGIAYCAQNLIEPKQVHGDEIVVVDSNDPEQLANVRQKALKGADAIVCTAPDVPVLLCFADCTPVVLIGRGGFAVVHSGWRGTLAKISGKAACLLCETLGTEPKELKAYIGPHILGADYEVSSELLATFEQHFGTIARAANTDTHLDMSAVIMSVLLEAGLEAQNIVDTNISTATNLDRFYSYRAEKGICGRHGALCCMKSEPVNGSACDE